MTCLRRTGIILFFALIVLLGTCSLPPLQQRIDPSLKVAGLDVAAEQATALPQLPTVTPWLTPTSTPTATAVPSPTEPPTVTPFPTMPVLSETSTTSPALNGVAATIDTYMNDLVQAGYFSGAILVARNGTILISKGYGMADWQQNIPITSQSRIRLASLTKSFTAVSILMLQARNQLNLNDPICQYVPDCPATWSGINIRHLLTNTSGIVNYTDFADFDTTEMLPTTREELINRFRNEPLLYDPGLAYSYSNSNYVLLGMIIERVTGRSYADFVQANIFTPLAMQNSGYDQNVGAIRNQAIGYTFGSETAPFIDPSTLFAAGALYSTVEDMYRWDQALYTEQLLPQALLDEMFTPVLAEYGYGWYIQGHLGHRLINHSGLINGFSNYIARYPDDRLTVIVLSNMQTSASVSIGLYLAQMVFEQ